jgi:(p)ppGpp synthase/HD superfamily hydrolase
MPANESGPGLSPRFQEALTYAAQLHNPQTRKGTALPYVSHLLAVAGPVLEHGGSGVMGRTAHR